MRREDAEVKQVRRWEAAPEVLLMRDSAYQVYFDALTDTVEQIEIGGPGPDGQSEGDEPTITVLFEDIDLFRTPAARVVELIDRSRSPAERHTGSDEAFDWPLLGLSLWRSDPLDPSLFFESVSLMREDLFDAGGHATGA